LSFHVSLDPLKRSATSTGGKVGRRPKNTAPITSSDIPTLKSEQSRRCSLEGVNQGGNGVLRRVLNKQVNVIFFAVTGDKHTIHCGADLAKMAFEPIDRWIVKELSTILCNKYKVTDQLSDGMSTPTIFCLVHLKSLHRPSR